MTQYYSKSRDLARKRHHFAILRAAMEVFSDKGFHEARIEDIAEKASLSTGAVYNHFSNKKELFFEVIEWGEHQLFYQLSEARKRCRDIRKTIENQLRTYFRFFEKREQFFRVLIQEKYQFHKELKTHFTKCYDQKIEEFEIDIKRGIEEGIIRNIDPHTAAVIVSHIANGLFFNWIYSESKTNITDLYNKANDFISHALFNDNDSLSNENNAYPSV